MNMLFVKYICACTNVEIKQFKTLSDVHLVIHCRMCLNSRRATRPTAIWYYCDRCSNMVVGNDLKTFRLINYQGGFICKNCYSKTVPGPVGQTNKYHSSSQFFSSQGAYMPSSKYSRHTQSYGGRQSKVKIWWDTQTDSYNISTPYEQQFVDTIKALIPHSDRAYNPSSKVWTFTEKYLTPVENMCKKIWGDGAVTTINKQRTQQASASPAVRGAPIDSILVDFMKLMPFEAVSKAYRHAALMFHPDRGGDMEKMTKINSLWTRIKEEVYKQ